MRNKFTATVSVSHHKFTLEARCLPVKQRRYMSGASKPSCPDPICYLLSVYSTYGLIEVLAVRLTHESAIGRREDCRDPFVVDSFLHTVDTGASFQLYTHSLLEYTQMICTTPSRRNFLHETIIFLQLCEKRLELILSEFSSTACSLATRGLRGRNAVQTKLALQSAVSKRN